MQLGSTKSHTSLEEISFDMPKPSTTRRVHRVFDGNNSFKIAINIISFDDEEELTSPEKFVGSMECSGMSQKEGSIVSTHEKLQELPLNQSPTAFPTKINYRDAAEERVNKTTIIKVNHKPLEGNKEESENKNGTNNHEVKIRTDQGQQSRKRFNFRNNIREDERLNIGEKTNNIQEMYKSGYETFKIQEKVKDLQVMYSDGLNMLTSFHLPEGLIPNFSQHDLVSVSESGKGKNTWWNKCWKDDSNEEVGIEIVQSRCVLSPKKIALASHLVSERKELLPSPRRFSSPLALCPSVSHRIISSKRKGFLELSTQRGRSLSSWARFRMLKPNVLQRSRCLTHLLTILGTSKTGTSRGILRSSSFSKYNDSKLKKHLSFGTTTVQVFSPDEKSSAVTNNMLISNSSSRRPLCRAKVYCKTPSANKKMELNTKHFMIPTNTETVLASESDSTKGRDTSSTMLRSKRNSRKPLCHFPPMMKVKHEIRTEYSL